MMVNKNTGLVEGFGLPVLQRQSDAAVKGWMDLGKWKL
jgi:hypothetical protein